MAMATSSNVESVAIRLKKLEDIEKKITLAIKTAGMNLYFIKSTYWYVVSVQTK